MRPYFVPFAILCWNRATCVPSPVCSKVSAKVFRIQTAFSKPSQKRRNIAEIHTPAACLLQRMAADMVFRQRVAVRSTSVPSVA
uniref:Uncharacterized protein n=1 Tax=Sphaerodactylus townsendi TaxID=933632 RepID=A0ACB8FVP9_9SAUR